MNAPYAITTVMVNENLKKVVEPKKRKFKFLSYFFCAAIAGKKNYLIIFNLKKEINKNFLNHKAQSLHLLLALWTT